MRTFGVMVKAYKVAEHIFEVQLPDAHPLWRRMGQYAPFEVEPGHTAVFSLSIVESLDPETLRLVYDPKVEPGETLIKLWECSEGWYAETYPSPAAPLAGKILMNSDYSEVKLEVVHGGDSLFAINNALMLCYAFSTVKLGTLEMHASVIKNGGKGYLFLAASGTGKSTHSQLWLKHIEGSSLLNDDNPIVRVLPDGEVRVFGSPWSGKTPCYINDSCPVGAFVNIRRAPQNRLEPLSIPEGYALVYSSSSGFKADPAVSQALYETVSAIALSQKCFAIYCRPDQEAAEVCAAGVRD